MRLLPRLMRAGLNAIGIIDERHNNLSGRRVCAWGMREYIIEGHGFCSTQDNKNMLINIYSRVFLEPFVVSAGTK